MPMPLPSTAGEPTTDLCPGNDKVGLNLVRTCLSCSEGCLGGYLDGLVEGTNGRLEKDGSVGGMNGRLERIGLRSNGGS